MIRDVVHPTPGLGRISATPDGSESSEPWPAHMQRLICKPLALACGAMLAPHPQASTARDMTP